MIKFKTFLLSVILCGSFGVELAQAKVPVCGKIKSMRGRVDILRLPESEINKKSPVRHVVKGTKKFKLKCMDIIVTGAASRAKLRFNNKAILTMGPHSRISILEYAKKSGDASLLKLTYGKVRTFFKGNKKKSKASKKALFRIKTPTAVAGVRGTDFYLSYNPNQEVTEQATIKGKVEVEQVETGQKVMVEKGQQVKVKTTPELPPKPKNVANASAPLAPPAPAPLVVEPIKEHIIDDIKSTSVIVKDEKVFVSKEAIALLGAPETWKPPKDEIPDDLKTIEEVF